MVDYLPYTKDKVSREDERRPPALAQKVYRPKVDSRHYLGLSIFCHVKEREANLAASREITSKENSWAKI